MSKVAGNRRMPEDRRPRRMALALLLVVAALIPSLSLANPSATSLYAAIGLPDGRSSALGYVYGETENHLPSRNGLGAQNVPYYGGD